METKHLQNPPQLSTGWAPETYHIEARDKKEAMRLASGRYSASRPQVVGLVTGVKELGHLTNGYLLFEIRVEAYRNKTGIRGKTREGVANGS